jgi:hypothetical protein
MNPEKKTQIKVILKLLVVVIFASLYGWGGMEMKWLRRFVAPAILCLSAFGLSRNWRYLVQMPAMMITLSLGYGADSVIGKIFKRFMFGTLNGSSSSTVNIWQKKWLLVGFQIVLISAAYIVLGVWNPLPSARAEETLLGALIALIPMMSVKDYEKE